MVRDRIGSLVVTRYLIVQAIAAGGMGQVYLAKDLRLNAPVAVKFLNHTLSSPELCDRFLLEAQICAQLSSSSNHIVLVSDFGLDQDGIPFLVMKYLQGQSLEAYLEAQPVPLPLFLTWMEQICVGLKCAHDGIATGQSEQRYPVIHCDLKPSNVFLEADETLGVLVKILDFGVAQLMQVNTQTGFVAGTLPYCSPEQLRGDALDPRSDIYSLGIVMFEMLTQQRPIQAMTPDFRGWYAAHHAAVPRQISTLLPHGHMPAALEQLIMACLAVSPCDRPPSIAAILGTIRSLSASGSSHAAIQLPLPTSTMTALNALQTTQKHPPLLVFPRAVQHHLLCQPTPTPERIPALWVKLPHALIQAIQIYRLYNEIRQYFRFCSVPQHPTMLWATAIANPQLGVRWFTCYLDLSTPAGRDIVFRLPQTRTYQYLFFDAESPHWLSHQITCQLESEAQQQTIQRAAIECLQPAIGSFQSSQHQLQQAFAPLKATVTQQIQSCIQQRWH